MEDVHVPCTGVWCVIISTLLTEIQLEIVSFKDTDVLHLRVMKKHIVVLSSAKAISDLVDKRSNVYSDRVRSLTTFIPICGLITWFQSVSPMLAL